MNRATPQNAVKYATWLATQHPGAFREVLRQVEALRRSPLGRQGRLGLMGDAEWSPAEVGETVSAPDFSSVDTSSYSPELTLTDITFDPGSIDISSSVADALAAPITFDASLSDASQSSMSFWDTLSSGASQLASSIGKVATAVLSPQTIGAVSAAATSYFNAQAQSVSAQSSSAQAQWAAQTAQAQLARVNAGLSPAPIAYQRDPATGQIVPVYQSNTGPRVLNQPLLNQLRSPIAAGLTLSNPWVVGGVIALVMGATLLASRR